MIRIKCFNQELDALEEYVYSMRKEKEADSFDYNEIFVNMINPLENNFYKVAVKIPDIKTRVSITGAIEINIQN